jgi:hypothetical protein
VSPTVFFGWPGESQSALVASLSPDRIDGQRRAASPSQRRRAEERKDAHCRPWHPWRNTPPPGQMVLRDNRASLDLVPLMKGIRYQLGNLGVYQRPEAANEATPKARTRNRRLVVILIAWLKSTTSSSSDPPLPVQTHATNTHTRHTTPPTR